MPQREDLRGVDPSEYKNIPGNQTANTPDVDESASRSHGGGHEREAVRQEAERQRGRGTGDLGVDTGGVDPSEYKNIPGNQTANTPDVNESER